MYNYKQLKNHLYKPVLYKKERFNLVNVDEEKNERIQVSIKKGNIINFVDSSSIKLL